MNDNKTANRYVNKKPPVRGPMGGMMGTPVQKAKDFKGTLNKLIRYIRPFINSILIVLFFAILSTTFTVIGPKILGRMTNQIVDDYVGIKAYEQIMQQLPPGTIIPDGTKGEDFFKNVPLSISEKIPADQLEKIKNLDLSQKPEINFIKIAKIAIWLIAIYVLSLIFGYIQGWVISGVAQKITYQFRKDISKKINRMPLGYFDKNTYGEVLSRVTNDVDTISQTLNQGISQIVTSVTTIIGFIVMMLSISWLMTLVALIMLPVSALILSLVMRKSQRYFKSQQDSLGNINGHIEEMYGGHIVMKAFNGEEKSIKKFRGINGKLYHSAWKSQFLSGLMFPAMNFIGNLGYVGVAVLGGWLAVQGKIKIGDIQAFIQYVQQFNQPIAQTANMANIMQSTVAAAERVFEFLNENEVSEETSSPIILKGIKGSITFDNIRFGYDKEKIIIDGLSANIKPGQKVAIVGPTGAGKTTLVNLLMRFYEINSGMIKIDGIDITKFKRSDLRKMFGMVLQDTWLFNGTIRENIAYGNKNASEQEIIEAAKAAHVDHFVHSLPDGYEMILNEESDNISQGEKQLLTIARAMLTNPPILILDEATSSVDTRTEVLIQRAMDTLSKGKTSFIIAHRLSTIRNADIIFVINNGNIVEQGNHETLLKENGFYASLYKSQFALSK